MTTELQEYLRDAVLEEKYQLFVDVDRLMDEIGVPECQEKATGLLYGRGDEGTNDLTDEIEQLYIDWLEKLLGMHGVIINSDADLSMAVLADLLKAMHELATTEMRDQVKAKLLDSESSTVDVLFDLVTLVEPDFNIQDFYDTVVEVEPALLDKIEEVMDSYEEPELVDSFIIHTAARMRYVNSKAKEVEGPVREFLLNDGSFDMDIRSVEIAVSDSIAELESMDQKVDNCIAAAIISSAPTEALEEAAKYIANGVVESYDETFTILNRVSKRLPEFGVNDG